MKARAKLQVFGLLKNNALVNPAGEVICELPTPLVMSGEGGLTTETELEAIVALTADQVTDITRKTWDGTGILVLLTLDE